MIDRWECTKCGTFPVLGIDQSYFAALGIYPLRCSTCGMLSPSKNTSESVKENVE